MNRPTAEVDNSQPVAFVSPAIAMIDEGNVLEEQGRIPEAMGRYEAAIQADPRCARAHLNRGNILLAGAKLDEARSAYELAIAYQPDYAAAHFNLGNLNSRAGEFELALRNYQAAIGIRPDFADAFVAMGNAFDSLDRIAEAVESYQRALAVNPNYAEVHFNLGMLEMRQGRAEEAIRSLRRALAIKPESEGILYELVTVFLARGKASEALPLLMPALERSPTWMNKITFVSCVERVGFLVNDSRIRAALESAITEPWGRPYRLSRSALSLIVLDRRIASCVRLVNASWPARLPKAAVFGADGLTALAQDSLLHAVLAAAPVSTVEFERFLTCARHALLETVSNEQAPDPSDIAALRFYTALAQQCFVNEYIFNCDDREKLAASACRTKLLTLLNANDAVPPLLLLSVAAYFPLYSLRDASRLLDSNYPVPLDAVLRQQIREPLEEQALRPGIKCLTPITVGVSHEVRSQYEQNPYPRWVKLPKHEQPLSFNGELRRSLLAPFTPLPDDRAPEALIAGCGTGCHSVSTAQRFRGIRVLAIDLSLSSISYAKRKTQELGITNIEYAQADILKLDDIGRTFDIIESVGVLHHLADPFTGWRILLSLLRPGGFMFLGFYSELARRPLVKAREIIAERGYCGTPDAIRGFRQHFAVTNPGVELQSLSQFPDFFSTSECRDMLFHVQEHRLTLSQIEGFLVDFGLHFIGFDLDRSVLHQYRARFTDDPFATHLRNWATFEADNPDTFAGMYQFWIQKPP